MGSSTFAVMPCSIYATSSLLRGLRTASGAHLGRWMTGGTMGDLKLPLGASLEAILILEKKL